jgi:N-terminal acetyltransferase B complex catalytic subunit
LFSFNTVNLDHWTETYSISFYLSYLAVWPDLSYTQLSPSGRIMGYVIGKAEGSDPGPRSVPSSAFKSAKEIKERHGHVTAITVAPEYRRLGVAQGLMKLLEKASAEVYQVRLRNQESITQRQLIFTSIQAYFVDLFVRPSNQVAVAMYEGLDYSVYRKVAEYYQGGGKGGADEDGYGEQFLADSSKFNR